MLNVEEKLYAKESSVNLEFKGNVFNIKSTKSSNISQKSYFIIETDLIVEKKSNLQSATFCGEKFVFESYCTNTKMTKILMFFCNSERVLLSEYLSVYFLFIFFLGKKSVCVCNNDSLHKFGCLGYPPPDPHILSSVTGPHKSFNKLNLLLVNSSHYDHVHITFNGLRVI